MKKIFFLLIIMIVLTAHSFSFEKPDIIHDQIVLENVEEVVPFITTGIDFPVYDNISIDSPIYEIVVNYINVSTANNLMYRRNLFLYSQIKPLRTLTDNLFTMPCAISIYRTAFHRLC